MEITAQMVTAAYNAMKAKGMHPSADNAREVVEAVLATIPAPDPSVTQENRVEAIEWAVEKLSVAPAQAPNITLLERTDCIIRLARFRLGEDL